MLTNLFLALVCPAKRRRNAIFDVSASSRVVTKIVNVQTRHVQMHATQVRAQLAIPHVHARSIVTGWEGPFVNAEIMIHSDDDISNMFDQNNAQRARKN